MLKLKNVISERVESGTKYVEALLYADTKSEVTNSITGSDVEGLANDVELDTGSMVLTAAFEPAQKNSSGQWIWG